jgi:hypothetical protein
VELREPFCAWRTFSAHAIDRLLKKRLTETHVRERHPEQTRTPLDDHRVNRHPSGLND